MFRRSSIAKHRREYERQRAAEFLFERRPLEHPCVDRRPGVPIHSGSHVVVAAGSKLPYLLTRLDELRLSRVDVPALTVTADPANSVTVVGSPRTDWFLRFCAQGEAQEEEDARKLLQQISMTHIGGRISLNGLHVLSAEPPRRGRGSLVAEAPADAPLVIHASYAAVEIRDMTGPVRVAASHGRTTLLNTSGQVDATAYVIDCASDGGGITLSAEAEINLKLSAARFDGKLLAWAQRSVRVLVSHGFVTPFRAHVSRPESFVCRTKFCSQITGERKGELHYFNYPGDQSAAPESVMHLRSEQATVVIDTIEEKARPA